MVPREAETLKSAQRDQTLSLQLAEETLPKALVNAQRFKAMTGVSYRDMWREGNAMRRAMDLSWTQMIMAANTPMLLKAGLVDGNTESGVLASGQVVGVLDDLTSCDELVARIMGEAEATLARLT